MKSRKEAAEGLIPSAPLFSALVQVWIKGCQLGSAFDPSRVNGRRTSCQRLLGSAVSKSIGFEELDAGRDG